MKRWSEEELLFLEDNIGKMSYVKIEKKLNRSVRSIHMKAHKLGINSTRKEADGLTALEICKLTHIARKTLKQWIDTRGFPAKKKVTKESMVTFFVDPVAFWEWAYENKERFNFFLIEKNSIMPEPEWVDEQRKIDYYKPIKSPKPWTLKEEAKLRKMIVEEKLTYKAASELLPGRTPIAVQWHWKIMREREASKEPQNVL